MTKAFDVVNTLKCRPLVPDTLNCRFEAAKIRMYKEGLFELARLSIEDLGTNDEPFEIKFNQNGISHLIVTKNMEPWTVDMIRLIVNQLNIGIDIKDKPDGQFPAIEKSYFGERNTMVLINHQQLLEDRWKDDKFEIIPMNNVIKKLPGEVLNIEKIRYFDNNNGKKVYFFGSLSVYSMLPPDVITTVKSSSSNIIISDSNFTSYTANEIIVSNKERSRNFTLYEKIKLNLEVISATKSELPSIPNATLVSFMIQDDWYKDEERYFRTKNSIFSF
ncbi:hypothetical protein M0802_013257 [Mischocyttarus mexicanus]|nr:hypothetical protein M0802_013257 [Mischocyttarus mexicanus]